MAPGQLKSLLGTLRRKPATAPDRQTDSEAALAPQAKETSIWDDLKHLGFKNAEFLASALPALASGAPLDDKELLLEHGVEMLQKMPLNSGLSHAVSDGFIKMLYSDLPHPAATEAGPVARYRRHDGGNNNLWNPEMGKAGAPYCRNVPPVKPKGPNLPDPELVFEQLLKRPEGTFKEHPSGLNRLFFSFATIVIHECFQTNRQDPWINDTSSYVDLSTLYGNTEKEQPRVRTYSNGTIYPDAIASERIMLMPPGVVALLILFSRNHNTIAKDLLTINEGGKYRAWESLNEDEKKWQDNDIFQLARNINVGFFATVVLKDYVAAILNTPRADSLWSLDLGKEIKSGGSRVERGQGNVVSVEFAVLYHWHAALSAADATWMEGVLRQTLPDLKSLDDMTPELFGVVLKKAGHSLMATPPKDWTFYNLKRGPGGAFDNRDLAELIMGCVEEPAHAFGHHGTPASLKVVDIMGQLQARNAFNVCTMNEFRQYLNLKPYTSFYDWCEDESTAKAAELLYGHVDNLELYPGLMAECTKPAVAGSGVCPGQTTGRGILDDAVALVRGDRYLSYDFNSNTLTNWGVSKLADLPGGAYGGMLPKLIFNGLPISFPGTSSYALLPFYTPKAVQGILKGNKVIQKYDIKRPRSDPAVAIVYSADGCKKVLGDPDNFRPAYKEPKTVAPHFFTEGIENLISEAFSTKAADLIKESSLKYHGTKRSINVVRDVANIVPVSWLAERFAVPIKSLKTPRGLLSLPELFGSYMAEFLYQHFNVLPVNEWQLREKAAITTPTLKTIVGMHLKTQQGFKEKIIDKLEKGTAYEVGPEADRLYHALNQSGQSQDVLVDECIQLASSIAGITTQQTSLLIDLFLSEGYEQHKERIVQLAQHNDSASAKELQHYVLEGLRQSAYLPGLRRVASSAKVLEDGKHGSVQVEAGEAVIVATSVAALDPSAFPEPSQLNIDRPLENYEFLVGANVVKIIGPAIAAIIKEVFKLKNVRRAPGPPGHFTKTVREFAGLKLHGYLDANAKESLFPTSLMLEYDEDLPQLNGTANGHANGQLNGSANGTANGVSH